MAVEKLKKTLGFSDVFCISAGAMISSGIFVLPGLAFSQIGPAVFLAYLLAGVCALIGTLATVELATAMPLAGGIYFYTERSMGPLAGTISGLLNWCAIALKSAFAIFGMSEVLFQFFGWEPILTGVCLTLLFLMVNIIGTKAAAWTQLIMVVLLLASMGAYIVLGFPELKPSRFTPLFFGDKSYTALFAEAAFVFVAFGGLLDVASISEEVKNPRKNLPWGMISALVTVTVIYVLVLIVTVGAMDGSVLSKSFTPLADAARLYYGTPGFVILTFGAMMAFVTTANAGVMAAARFPYAMGRDKLIPSLFCRTYTSGNIPLPALLITGAVMAAVQLMPLEDLVTVASTVIMLSFILTNFAVIILRESKLQNYRPTFRMPFYPLSAIVSIALFALLIMELGFGSVKISLGIIFAGFILYFLFGRKVTLESALVHLVSRITRKRIPNHGLERELREILRARDNIGEDSFDRTVTTARVVLENESRDFSDLVHRLCPDRSVTEALINREKESPTTLTPYVAVPHLRVHGEDVFDVVIVKSVKGIYFNRNAKNVHAIIFLFGSPDKRNQHLKALAAIAQTIQSPSFENRWEHADTPEKIRDLLLLSKRTRSSI